MEDSFEIDCRVRDTDGFRGTIRYIGPVAAAKNKTETWLGVEWDKQDRGAGSFVKMNKVMGGRSLGDALRERYVGMDAPSFTRIDDPVLPGSFVTTSKGNTKPIEFHGEHKVRLYQQLSKVDAVAVRNDTVANIEPNIGASIGHVIEVDLQDNLIYKWSELATLTACVPGLQTLLLHGNRMQDVTPQIAASLPPLCYSNLRTLALNACSINSWASMHRLAQFLPAIEQLYLSGNCLEDLPKLPTASTASDDQINQNIVSIFTEVETSHAGVSNAVEQAALVAAREAASAWTALRVLDISGCKINDWSQILFFAFFPSLEEILLDSNPFERIAPCPISGFSALSRLSCSDTLLKEWADIDALATYAQMANLRLSHIPLFSGRGASEVRPYVIARIPQLDFFNGSTIRPRERVDAEKTYLRSALRDIDDMAKAGRPLTDSALRAVHPRFSELQRKHGNELLPIGALTSGGGSTEPVAKKLPASMTVERIKLVVKQLFNLDPSLQQLSLLVYKDAPPTLLDDDRATLNYYGAQDGAKIFINEA